MKKKLLPFIVALGGLFTNSAALAQCIPVNCLSNLPSHGGICDIYLLTGRVGSAYSDFESFHVTNACFDAGILDAGNAGLGIRFVRFKNFTFSNLPTGLTGETNQSVFTAPANGCLRFFGTPTTAGVFAIKPNFLVDLNAYPLGNGSCSGVAVQQNNNPGKFNYYNVGDPNDGSSLFLTILPKPNFTIPGTTFLVNEPAVTLSLDANSTTGGIFSGPGVSGSSFNPATAGVGTHTLKYRVSAQQGNAIAAATDSFSISVIVTGGASTSTWTGASNGNWSNASNWNSNVVPTGVIDVVIPAGTVNAISTGGVFSSKSVTIQAGATVGISSGGVWNIGGNLQGTSGSNITGTGKVVLNGSAAQSIIGSISVSNLDINNVVQITTGSSLNILPTASNPNALLSLLSGSALSNNGNLILRSNSFGTGSIGPIPGNAVINGNITQERLLPMANGWYFVGAPMKSASTLLEWSELNPRITPKQNASIFEYSESDSTTGTYLGYATEINGWKVPNSVGAAINPSNQPKGYRMFLGASNPTRLASVTGLPFTQNVPSALSFSPATGFSGGGWNLISNPYPCAINWNQLRNDGANSGQSIGNAYYLWNGTTGNYGSYTSLGAGSGVGVGGLQESIPSSQAFFVKATGAASLTFKESFKNTSAASLSFLRTATSDPEFLKFKVQQGSNWDEAGVLFYPGSEDGQDNFDALNLTGSAVDVAAIMDNGTNAAINVLPQIGEQRIIPLKVQTPLSGPATFRFEGMENIPSTISMYLKDDFLGSLTDIRQNPEISFEAEAGQVYNRFSLILAEQVLTGSENNLVEKKLSLHPNPASNRVSVYSPAAGELELINALGQKIKTQSIKSGRNEVNLTGLPKGMYQVRLKGLNVEKLLVE